MNSVKTIKKYYTKRKRKTECKCNKIIKKRKYKSDKSEFHQLLLDSLMCLPEAIISSIIYEYVIRYTGESFSRTITLNYVNLYMYMIDSIEVDNDKIYLAISNSNNSKNYVDVIDKKSKKIVKIIETTVRHDDAYINSIDMIIHNNELLLFDVYNVRTIDKNYEIKKICDFPIPTNNHHYNFPVTAYENKTYILDTKSYVLHVFDNNTKMFINKYAINKNVLRHINNISIAIDNNNFYITGSIYSKNMYIYCFDIYSLTKKPYKIKLKLSKQEYESKFKKIILTDDEIFAIDYLNNCIRVFDKLTKKYIRNIKNDKLGRFTNIKIFNNEIYVTDVRNNIHIWKRNLL